MSTVLITGGSGFLGRHLAKKLSKLGTVVLGARNNGNNRLAEIETGCTVVPLDVTNERSIRDALHEFRPDTIIHAAAAKFVDICEKNPFECVDVNVVGSTNIARQAIECGVERVVGISTDKAAPPVGNIYGHSKAIMERLFCALDGRTRTKFVCVRFGNIAWSTGSVFPVWRRMTQVDKKIRTTGPHMRRFFFTVNDAADLVIIASRHIERLHGGILAPEMKAAQIEDILKIWSRHFSVPYERVDERPGDRPDEVLIGALELPHVQALEIEGRKYYFIDLQQKFSNAPAHEISSRHAQRFSQEEMLELITNAPEMYD